MKTIREIIAEKSTAAAGSTIREHFASPVPGGGVSTDPGDTNVLLGIPYQINSVQFVGKRNFPPLIVPLPKITLYQVADAVSNMIRAAMLPVDVFVRRSWNPQSQVSELKDRPIVSVVPTSQDEKWESRSKKQTIFNIDVGLQKKLAATENADIDSIVAVSNSICGLFTAECLDWYLPGTICLGASHDPIVSSEHLDQHRVCTSLLSVRFMDAK